MVEINVDTNKIQEASKDIIAITEEMNELITFIFETIQKISNANGGAWIGDSANQFVYEAMIDKANYITLKNDIYEFGKYLGDYAHTMDKEITEVEGK